MKGCKPLNNKECKAMNESFTGKFAIRNRLMFELGRLTGLRISEILSIRIKDVFKAGKALDAVYIAKRKCKGKKEGKNIVLTTSLQKLIKEYIISLKTIDYNSFLFKSNKGSKAISIIQAYRIIQNASNLAGVTGKVGTHSMRKTFANVIHLKLGSNLLKTQKALHHKNVNSTVQYISLDQQEINQAILSMD